MGAPKLPEPDPVPESESDTAARAAAVVRSRRARGGRAKLILNNARALDLAPTTGSGGALRPAGGFSTTLGGARGRAALVNI